MKKIIYLLIVTLLFISCTSSNEKDYSTLNKSDYLKYLKSNIGYQPIDPIRIDISKQFKLENHNSNEIIKALDSSKIMFKTKILNSSGAVSLGPASLGSEGNTYKVTLDYLLYRTETIFSEFYPRRTIKYVLDKSMEEEFYKVDIGKMENAGHVAVPVYFGVGIRVVATIKVLKGDVNLVSLQGLGVDAKNKNISGSISIERLGISGPAITDITTITTNITEESINSLLRDISTLKAKIYNDKTIIKPSIVGYYNSYPITNEELESQKNSILTSYEYYQARSDQYSKKTK